MSRPDRSASPTRLAARADEAMLASEYTRARQLYAEAAAGVTELLGALEPRRRQLRALLTEELPRLITFARLTCGTRLDALCAVADMLRALDAEDDALVATAQSREELLARLVHHLRLVLGPSPRGPVDLAAGSCNGEKLTEILGALPLARRLALITEFFGIDFPTAAALLDTRPRALKALRRRARDQLEDDLGVRPRDLDQAAALDLHEPSDVALLLEAVPQVRPVVRSRLAHTAVSLWWRAGEAHRADALAAELLQGPGPLTSDARRELQAQLRPRPPLDLHHLTLADAERQICLNALTASTSIPEAAARMNIPARALLRLIVRHRIDWPAASPC